jgi:hypothetical protein
VVGKNSIKDLGYVGYDLNIVKSDSMPSPSNNESLPSYDQKYSIENRNFLSPVGFKFSINKLKGVEFFTQSATIPGISMGSATQGTPFNKIPHPGDELYYEDLQIKFLVDENMKNWYQVHDWMREITTPYSSKEFGYSRGSLESKNPITRRVTSDAKESQVSNQWRSDASLFILSSNYRPVAEFVFHDLFPIALSPLNFDTTPMNDIEYFTCNMVMRYTYYDYYIYDAATATDSSMKSNFHTSVRGINIDTVPSQ